MFNKKAIAMLQYDLESANIKLRYCENMLRNRDRDIQILQEQHTRLLKYMNLAECVKPEDVVLVSTVAIQGVEKNANRT